MTDLVAAGKIVLSIVAIPVIGFPLLRDGVYSTYLMVSFDHHFSAEAFVFSLFFAVIGGMVTYYSAKHLYFTWQRR